MDRRTFVVGAAALASGPRAIFAQQDQITRPVKMIVPAGPGGFTDIVARVASQGLTEKSGQSFIVENRGGAGGIIGAVAVKGSSPDGYTLLMGNNNTHAMNSGLYKSLPYDPVADFMPIAFVGSAPTVLVVPASSPFKTVDELIEAAKARPGVLTYGSGGVGASSHLAAELLKQRADVDVIHVPFKGNAPGVQALLGEQVTFMFDTLPSARPLVLAGKLKALGVTSLEPVDSLPGVPAVAKTLPGFEVTAWIALFAPKGTPSPMVDALDRMAAEVLANPATIKRLQDLGVSPRTRRTTELQKFVSAEISKWNEVIQRAGIAPQ